MTFKKYRRKGDAEARPYVPGENLAGVSVSVGDVPKRGGMIARNPTDHDDQWYITPEYFKDNFETEPVKE